MDGRGEPVRGPQDSLARAAGAEDPGHHVLNGGTCADTALMCTSRSERSMLGSLTGPLVAFCITSASDCVPAAGSETLAPAS